ncbi:hypothetical protein TSAR_014335 [Trichomalopsis sarcophagae]|uniref:Uncharacterized protein n=1 Tax=Trichomalopsis sarcophagae TaxID=543379 RepID=A0A232EUM9_9HYME|nr:hypothetical protein TSAR_014335 [Trichomalopsis sarcophagae]
MSTSQKKQNYEVCGDCNLPIQIKDPKRCEMCTNYYHATCIKFRSLLVEGLQTFTCSICAEEYLRKKSGPLSNSLGTSTTVNSPTSMMNASLKAILSDIQKALKDIELKQDEALESHRQMTTRVAEIELRLGPIQTRLKAVDQLPQIVTRMTAAEATIAELQSQFSELTSKGSSTNQPSSQELSCSKATDPAEIAYLMGQLREIKKQQATSSTSNVAVLTGLQYGHDTALRLLVFAVLSALDPTVLRRDIISVRIMGRLDNRAADSKMPPLAVTLSSHALVYSSIASKIKRGKLHTSELSVETLREANANSPWHTTLLLKSVRESVLLFVIWDDIQLRHIILNVINKNCDRAFCTSREGKIAEHGEPLATAKLPGLL